jgi:hypothetical protein
MEMAMEATAAELRDPPSSFCPLASVGGADNVAPNAG